MVRSGPAAMARTGRLALTALLIALGACMTIRAEPENQGRGPAPLPSGPGLAARYPGDHGLGHDPAVVFADDVEAAADETSSSGVAPHGDCRRNDRWGETWGQCRMTRDASHVHAGGRALEFSVYDRGSVGVRKQLATGFDRLFFRYYIRYNEPFPGAHHAGASIHARAPGVPFVNPGVVPVGANQFGVLLDHWSFDPTIRAPGHLVAYVYHMDQQHRWGEQFHPSGRTRPDANGRRGIFGPSFVPRNDFVPALGRWYSYELMVQVNAPPARDGRVAFWIDGRLAADFPNLRFRSAESLAFNWIHLGIYESRRPGLRRIWLDDIVLAREYIGPMGQGS